MESRQMKFDANAVPHMLICAKSLEELVEHGARCGGIVVPKLNERYVFKMTRHLPGEYRAKNWQWYGISNETQTKVPYLIALCPVHLFLSPLRGIPSCAACGAFSEYTYRTQTVEDDLDFNTGTKQNSTYQRRVTNYTLEKTVRCREFFACNSKYLTPIYVTCISATLVVVFRASHSVNDGRNGITELVAPETVSFAADWWMRNVASPSLSSKHYSIEAIEIFTQFTKLLFAAAKDGFVTLDATPFNMLILTSSAGNHRLVWPACLSWYFHDDRHVVQPFVLNTMDSCSFTLFVFRKLNSKSAQHRKGEQLLRNSSVSKRDINRFRGKIKKYSISRNLATTLLASDYEGVQKSADSLMQTSDYSIDSTLLMQRCTGPFRTLALLSLKSISVNHIAQVSLSVAAFLVGGFSELARKPSAYALSDKTRECCLSGTPCNLRHVFVAINPSSNVYEMLHKFVCLNATQATQNIIGATSASQIFEIVEKLLECKETSEMFSTVISSLRSIN